MIIMPSTEERASKKRSREALERARLEPETLATLLRDAMKHRDSWPFHDPVSTEEVRTRTPHIHTHTSARSQIAHTFTHTTHKRILTRTPRLHTYTLVRARTLRTRSTNTHTRLHELAFTRTRTQTHTRVHLIITHSHVYAHLNSVNQPVCNYCIKIFVIEFRYQTTSTS